MVTYSDLIQTGILVVGIIGLFIAVNNKEVTARLPTARLLLNHVRGQPSAGSAFSSCIIPSYVIEIKLRFCMKLCNKELRKLEYINNTI